MKKVVLLFAVFSLIFSLSLPAQNTLTVADSTQPNSLVPVYGYSISSFQRCQVIYPAEMLAGYEGLEISAVTFYFSSAPASSWTSTFNVKLGTAAADTFPTADFLPNDLNTVYSGRFFVTDGNLLTIQFSTPFLYTGGNLLFEVATLMPGTNSSSSSFYGKGYPKASVSGSSSTSAYDIPYKYYRNFIPKTTFTFIDTCTTLNLGVSSVSSSSAFVTWNPNPYGSSEHFELSYRQAGTSSWTVFSNNITENYVMLNGLQPDNTYEVQLRTWCGGGYTDGVTTTFTTECTGGGHSGTVTVGSGNGTTNGNTLPVNTYYKYNYTQQIFTAEELGSPITINQFYVQYFYNTNYTRDVDIYMGHTSKSSFASSNDWISAGDLTLVYSGNIVFTNTGENNWLNIPLTTPFAYNGTDNLVIVFDDNTGSWSNSSAKFYTHACNDYRSLVAYSDNTNFTPTSPGSGGNTYMYRMNLRIPLNCIVDGCDRGNVAAVDITATSAKLVYTLGNGSTNFEIQYRSKGGSFVTVPATSSPYLLTGLMQNTEYTVRIRTHCATGWSEWKSTKFTTRTKECSRLYVKTGGTGDGTSWAEACADLSWALNTAAIIKTSTGTAPDIWVAGGVYYGDTTALSAFTMADGANVYGGLVGNEPDNYDLLQRDPNAHPTILDGQHARRVLNQPQNFYTLTVWDGVTLRNGYAFGSYGGGAYLRNNVHFYNCHFIGNSSTQYGGGVYASSTLSSSPIRFENCEFTGNAASGYGGGVYMGYTSLRHCIVSHNYAGQYGGGIYISSALEHEASISNCLVANNTADYGGGIYAYAYYTKVENSTIVNNTASTAGAGLYAMSFKSIANSILWGNRRNGSANSIDGGSNGITCVYNAVEGGFSGEGNVPILSEDLLNGSFAVKFAHPSATAGYADTTANVDWHLLPGSVCVNRGNDSLVTIASNTDLDGNPRVRRGQVDLGCYESDYEGTALSQVGDIIYVTQTGAGSRDGSSWANAMENIQTALSLATMGGADIWIAEGVYYGDTSSINAVTLKDGVSAYGGFAGNEDADFDLSLRNFTAHPTVLDGQNVRRVLFQPYSFANRTIWDGFTIRNGSDDGSGGGGAFLRDNTTLENCIITGNNSSYHGGGVYANRSNTSTSDSIKIIRCNFTNNTSYGRGGGYYAGNSGTIISHCTFSHNSSTNNSGGGMYIYAGIVSNCTFTHNTASYNYGGGIYQYRATISNCLVANNSSRSSGGGIYCDMGSVNGCTIANNEILYSSYNKGAGICFSDYDFSTEVSNCIIWGNKRVGVEDNVGGAGGVITYSAVEGGVPGEGNICLLPEHFSNGLLYPHFVNPSVTVGSLDTTSHTDWHLLNGSPCINHGSNQAVVGDLDLDGSPRIRHDTVDMGCYESDFDSITTIPQFGDIIYVTETGAGAKTGQNWDNALSSLQDAIDIAYGYGSDVWVAQGTYYGDGVSENAFIMRAGVSVYGGFVGNEPENYDLSLRDFNAHATILDGQNLQRVLIQPDNFSSTTAVIWDGFTIQHGGSYGGGAGVRLMQYATLSHCIIQNNTVYYNHASNNYSTVYGGGVYVSSNRTNDYKHTTFLKNCIIRNNMFENHNRLDGYGAGLYANCVEVTHTEVGHNTFAYRGGGIYLTSYSNFSNCLIYNNSSMYGGGVYISAYDIAFTNCDIVGNLSSNSAAGVYRSSGTSVFTNCIIWGNKRNYMPDNIYNGGTYNYCAVEDGCNGTGNITLAAANDGTDASQYYVRFLDPANDDYQIHTSSVCVNNGNNDVVTDSLDLYGNPRIFQNRVDIGCLESMENSNCPSVVSLTADNITTNSARLVWHPTGNESQWVLVYGLQGEQPTTVITSDTIYQLTGLIFNRNYTAKVRAVCNSELMSVFSIPVNFQTTCDPTILDTLDNFGGMSPADSSIIYAQPVPFVWSALPQATSYDLYLWRDGTSMPATPTLSGLVQPNATMNLPNYARGNVYHWKVVAWNECISKTSPVQTLRVNPYPDLHVSAVEYSNPVATQQMTVTWTVTNDGEGNTPPGTSWNDYIWISPVDGVGGGFWYNVSEVMLATVPNLTSLNAGESYQNTATVTIPEGYMGNYYLFVFTDQHDVRDINYTPTGQATAPNPYTPSADGDPYHYLSGTVHYSSLSKVTELPGHETDNFFYKVISILPPPSPDLVVSSVVHGGDAISGSPTNLTWTITNQGDAPAMGTWMDAVYISQDTILDTEEDLRLGRFAHTDTLSIGGSYQHTEQVNIPVEYMGNYYFIVVTDNNDDVYEGLGEQNNKGISQPLTVTLTWLTDLVVTAADMPAIVYPNGSHTCQFTVTNQGSSPTYTNSWKDAIYISTEAVFNPATAIKVGTVNHVGILDADTTYDVQWNVQIPNTLTGTFHWYVVVDELNQVFEYNADGNNIYMCPQTSTVQLPDLQVSRIVIPATVNPNENTILRWTVRNNGPGNLVGRTFSDQFLYNGEVFYSTTASNLSLAAGDSIIRTANIKLPCGAGNTSQFAIQTDYEQVVRESNESNNALTVPVTAAAPDLTISNLTIPLGEAWSGTTAEIAYTITNNGTYGTSNAQVTDKFYLSASADSYQESDLIGSYTHVLDLTPQAAATFYHTVNLPHGISGTYYYHVVCNSDTAVCENGSMADNVASSPATNVNLSPSPDLVITQITVPSQTYVGAEFDLIYTLKNQGNAVLHNANVTQKFYYSTSPTYCDTTKLLAAIHDNLSLGAHDSITLVAHVSLPITAQATRYFIHGIADAEDNVYEHNAEDNNANISNDIIASFYQLDIQLTEIDGPDVVQWGQNVTYRLHVVNNTALATLSNYWQDVLYFSADQTLQNSDVQLLMQTRLARLDGNADYWVEMPVTIPYGAPATSYLFGITDVNSSNPDINPSNNLLMKTITVNSVPTPDLAVDELVVLDDLSSGQAARIAYKVTNVSETAIQNGNWTDKLFLSFNNTYESGDIQLTTRSRNIPTLAQGEFYRDTLEFTIPLPNNGSLYLLLMANAANFPFEAERANNTAAVNVNVVLPPPGDLVVRDIACESTIVSGQMLHATWNIWNIGDNTMSGSGLKSLVYVSSDTLFDASDRLLGSVTSDINLPIDQAMQQSLTAKISGLRPGDYYLIVKTDVTNAFNEADDNNNAGHSAVPFAITIRPLLFNTDVADELSNNEVSDFMLEVGDNVGQTVRIHITSADSLNGAVNMIYISHNDMGDNLNYSYSTIGQFTANTELYIPATQSGFYGISIYGNTPSGNTQNVVVRADILPFELHAVNANHGGNTGEVTVELTGSRFRPGMTVTLHNNNEEITADTLIYVNYYQSFAKFDLTGRTPGVYDVTVFSNCEGEAVLHDGFTIENGVPSGLSYNLIFPSSPRPNRSVVMMLEFGNVGNVDLHDQVLEITSLGGSPISLTPGGVNQHNTVLQVPLSIEGEPEGLLRPGSYGTINIYGFTSGALMFTIKPVEE